MKGAGWTFQAQGFFGQKVCQDYIVLVVITRTELLGLEFLLDFPDTNNSIHTIEILIFV